MKADWVNRWRVWHAVFFAAIALSAAGSSGSLSMPSLSFQLILLAGPVAVLGIPHGALDFALGRELLQAGWGRFWPSVFLPLYSAVVLGIIALWIVAPGFSLTAFLLVSVWHFGTSDMAPKSPTGALQWLEALARGALVITFPAACYPDQVNELFTFLAPVATAGYIAEISALLAPVTGTVIVFCITINLGRLVFARNWNAGLTALELIGLTALFILTPPLLAFGIYFCLLHSLRHLLLAASRQQPACSRAGLNWMFKQATPVTLVTVGLAAMAYGLLGDAGLSQKLTQVIFIGLAALTFPHMLLAAIAERWRISEGPTLSFVEHLLNAR